MGRHHRYGRQRDTLETLLDFEEWLEGLADGSILYTGRYAQERLDREARRSANRDQQGADLSEEAEQWLMK